MRTLIVDDEAPPQGRLKRYLADLAGVEVIGEASDGVQAVEMIAARSSTISVSAGVSPKRSSAASIIAGSGLRG